MTTVTQTEAPVQTGGRFTICFGVKGYLCSNRLRIGANAQAAGPIALGALRAMLATCIAARVCQRPRAHPAQALVYSVLANKSVRGGVRMQMSTYYSSVMSSEKVTHMDKNIQ